MSSFPLNTDVGAVDFLQRLVEIRSLSGKETAVAQFLVTQMQQSGFTAYVDAAGNAVGERCCPDADGQITQEIVLLGHMDTVPGDIPVRQEDGKLFGRGSVDVIDDDRGSRPGQRLRKGQAQAPAAAGHDGNLA